MTKFEQSKTYQQIVANGYSNNITLAYHVTTDIFLTEDNIEQVIFDKIQEYNHKIEEVKKFIPTFEVPANADVLIRESVEMFLNSVYCDVDYATFSSDDMLDIVAEIEASPKFVKWLIE
jgi:hypothetical protein